MVNFPPATFSSQSTTPVNFVTEIKQGPVEINSDYLKHN